MKKILAITLVLVQCILVFNGCTKNTVSVDKKLTIGFSMATFKEDRWLQDRDIFTAKAKQDGFDVIVSNANNDSDLQYEQVADMVKKGIDILVIVPQDCDLAASCVNLANKNDIPVISYDRLVRSANIDAYISFDNVKVGELQAEALLKAVPTGGYLILNGSENDNNSKMFNEGYMNVLNSHIEKNEIAIVDETWVKDWRRETAFSFASAEIKKNPNKITGIIAANDSLAWGTIDALSEAKLTGQIQVVGHDADLAACQRIVDGTQLLTIYKPIKTLVDDTVKACKALANGKKLEYTETINNGSYEVPYIMIDVIPVTKDNIDDTVIKDGFQLKEDVYRDAK